MVLRTLAWWWRGEVWLLWLLLVVAIVKVGRCHRVRVVVVVYSRQGMGLRENRVKIDASFKSCLIDRGSPAFSRVNDLCVRWLLFAQHNSASISIRLWAPIASP